MQGSHRVYRNVMAEIDCEKIKKYVKYKFQFNNVEFIFWKAKLKTAFILLFFHTTLYTKTLFI